MRITAAAVSLTVLLASGGCAEEGVDGHEVLHDTYAVVALAGAVEAGDEAAVAALVVQMVTPYRPLPEAHAGFGECAGSACTFSDYMIADGFVLSGTVVRRATTLALDAEYVQAPADRGSVAGTVELGRGTLDGALFTSSGYAFMIYVGGVNRVIDFHDVGLDAAGCPVSGFATVREMPYGREDTGEQPSGVVRFAPPCRRPAP
jgi:hypothetical protein